NLHLFAVLGRPELLDRGAGAVEVAVEEDLLLRLGAPRGGGLELLEETGAVLEQDLEALAERLAIAIRAIDEVDEAPGELDGLRERVVVVHGARRQGEAERQREPEPEREPEEANDSRDAIHALPAFRGTERRSAGDHRSNEQ